MARFLQGLGRSPPWRPAVRTTPCKPLSLNYAIFTLIRHVFPALQGNSAMIERLRSLANSTAGATAVEYGLIGALITVAIMSAVYGAGAQLNTSYSRTSATVATVNA